ncbi:unnamed protein product [Fusarium langsethiae]|nr:unnamed protein product [Fusarium langsethiae]
MVRAIDMGWFILSKYYRLTDQVPVYAAALLLDPRKRIAYIKQNWPKEWHEDTIASATAFWQNEFNYERPSDHPSTPDVDATTAGKEAKSTRDTMKEAGG